MMKRYSNYDRESFVSSQAQPRVSSRASVSYMTAVSFLAEVICALGLIIIGRIIIL